MVATARVREWCIYERMERGRLLASTGAHANAYEDRNTNEHAHGHADPNAYNYSHDDSDTYIDVDRYAFADIHSHHHTDCNRHPNS